MPGILRFAFLVCRVVDKDFLLAGGQTNRRPDARVTGWWREKVANTDEEGDEVVWDGVFFFPLSLANRLSGGSSGKRRCEWNWINYAE